MREVYDYNFRGDVLYNVAETGKYIYFKKVLNVSERVGGWSGWMGGGIGATTETDRHSQFLR